MPAPNDFTMFAGNTKVIKVILRDANNSPIDLNEATVLWSAAKQYGANTLISKTNLTGNSGITVTDANNGVFEVTILPADTDTLGGKMLIHEARVQLSDGIYSTVLAGELTIEKTIIRADD